ncbi:DUF1285 domain-containing protein [Pontibacterium granulatum]|uniref:DUF1285 domain-containing protein n=1 Tax=Pontibacterium granulatum TaxID=2036029 RepID=UPI00249A33F4|nr:DUF1285 domain-containing protein [Pontibacterium granulatum]MDI3325429.1 DUF1285 domain-containing protein [Pontibacterium granulatum]
MTKKGFDLTAASKEIQAQGEQLPPLEKWNPEFCGDIDMHIKRDGSWFYNGTPIGRPAMVKLFSRVLWQEEGKYFLKTPVEKVGIEVDDVPFLMIAVEQREGQQGTELVFTSKTDDVVVAGAEHPIRVEHCAETGEPAPYIAVRFGMEGLIARNVFYELVELADEREIDGEAHLVIESQGELFSLGSLTE